MQSNDNNQLTSIQKLRIAMIVMILVLVGGTSGFMTLENMGALDALYMTVITLSTVGFSEVTTLHPAGRIFVIFLIIFGVALAGFTASAVGQLLLEGQFREMFGRRKMEGRIKKMKNHFIIAGFGRVGRQVATEFTTAKAPFLVMEKNAKALDELNSAGIPFVEGDATDEDTLKKAGIDQASTLISTLPDEAHNVYLTLTARHMNRDLKIIARADYEGGEKKLMRAGADHVVTPHILGGIRMAMASLRPNVVDFMHMTSLDEGGMSIEEIVIPGGCRFSGKSLVDSKLKKNYNVNLIGIKKTGQSMNITPMPDTMLDESDILVLIGPTTDLERLSHDIEG